VRTQTLFDLDPPTQLRVANTSTLTFAMVETKRGIGALDEILAVEGIDGIFVGPSDMSVTLTEGARVAPGDPVVEEPVRLIAERTLAAGKLLGAFAWGGERAAFFRDLGYRLIALGTDQAYLTIGIQKMLNERGPEVQI
jgi:4-hydroxy-2-oxoheptanedioate aldolase